MICGPARMVNGVHANIYYRRSTSHSSGWVCRMWIFFIRIVPIPTRRWKKRWARSRMRFAAARRFTREFPITSRLKPLRRRKFSANSARHVSFINRVTRMLDRWVEPQLLATLEAEGIGCTVFSPLAKGILTDRYFKGIPADSRAGHDQRFLRPSDITDVGAGEDKKTERPCAVTWPDARADGARMGVAAQSRDERAHRREQGQPGG